ncbi:hypothetical protein [Streptomyces sp. NBC_00035]|uniref:hypothetical protein n=1 Tax=Streptomyces sp. NBC_00035 TaxID=2903614 RepID=UPI003251EE21
MVDLERIKAETVAYFRALDQNATLRHHFRHADEEGGLWYIEAVPDRGELIVIKQAELTPAGQLHRYNWEHLEDEHSGLTDRSTLKGIRWRPSRPRSSSRCGLGERARQPL